MTAALRLCVLVAACASLCACAVPNVTLTQGLVVGAALSSLRGREIAAYRGIPYAKPPLGALRFKAPEPVDPSDAVVDATRDGPFCVQKNVFLPTPAVGGVEDCLTINVYSPQVEGGSPLPVMVFIHGGAWLSGAGASFTVGPAHLLDRDLVLVTFNYRLGALGLLSTGDAAARGNYAFKDQAAALRWVRDNIAAFGGDPASVTLFGESAGAASVHLHMFSDLSDGLFHRAIAQSGSALDSWAWPAQDPWAQAQLQGAAVGCAQTDSAALVECLRGVDAHALADSVDIFHFWSIEPITPYLPVVEAPWDGEGEQPFLTARPLDLVRQGRFQRKPWLTGVLAQEGILRALPILSDPLLLAELNARWDSLGPQVFQLSLSLSEPALVAELWANVTAFYFDGLLPVTPDNGIHLVDLYSDRLFMHGVHKATQMQAQRGHDSIYLYNFRYKGLYSYSASYAATPVADYGIAHADDLIYLLPVPGALPPWPQHHRDLKIVDSLVTLWANFATFGEPTPGGTSEAVSCDAESDSSDDRCTALPSLSWRPVPTSGDQLAVMDIWHDQEGATIEFRMDTAFYDQRMAFWDAAPLEENAQR